METVHTLKRLRGNPVRDDELKPLITKELSNGRKHWCEQAGIRQVDLARHGTFINVRMTRVSE